MNREQLLAIFWLRWRLSRNQFAKGSGLQAVISIILAVLLVGGAAAAGIGGFLLGLLAMAKVPPAGMLALWDVAVFIFLILWLSGIVVEIQRSESIDLTRLLHLPISLRQVFYLNYIISHATPSIVLFVPLMLGLTAGLCLSHTPAMVLMVPLIIAFVLVLSAWTYCLRGWLAALMINKRRRRTIVVWITITIVLVAQLPNLLVNSGLFFKKSPGATRTAASRAQVFEKVSRAHVFIPPGWLGYSAMAIKQGNPFPALVAAGVCGFGAFLGLRRAYRSTMRFYTGVGSAVAPAAPVQQNTKPYRYFMVGWNLPGLRDDTAALVWASFQSLLRAPEMKMAMIMPIVLVVIMFSAHFARARNAPPELLLHLSSAIAAVIACFSFGQVMSNMFGLDRSAFRALVLLSTPRHRILLGKNLAHFPFVMATGVVLLLLETFLLRLSVLGFIAGLIQVTVAFLLFSLACNFIAILAPYRFTPGSLQVKKPKLIVFVGFLLTTVLLPLFTAPAMVPGLVQMAFSHMGWLPWLPVHLLVSVGMLGLAVGVYLLLLPQEGRLLQAREKKILSEVTQETE